MVFSSLANGPGQFLFDKTLFAKGMPWYISTLMALFFAIFGWVMLTRPRLRCPGCASFLDKEIGRHCPEFGSDHLDMDFFGRPHCEACGYTMKYNKHGVRHFTIRNCTDCGLTVAHQGLWQ